MSIRKELQEEVVEEHTITTFKRFLDRCLDRKGLEGYGTIATIVDGQHGQVGMKGLYQYPMTP